jgi:hypothetical protein
MTPFKCIVTAETMGIIKNYAGCMYQETDVAYFKALCQYIPWQTESTKTSSDQTAETGTPRTRAGHVT